MFQRTLAVFGIQADEIGIGRFEVEPVLLHADAALADVVALVRLDICSARSAVRCARRWPTRYPGR